MKNLDVVIVEAESVIFTLTFLHCRGEEIDPVFLKNIVVLI